MVHRYPKLDSAGTKQHTEDEDLLACQYLDGDTVTKLIHTQIRLKFTVNTLKNDLR